MAAQVILVHLVHVRVVVSQHKRRFGTNSFETPFLVLNRLQFQRNLVGGGADGGMVAHDLVNGCQAPA